MPAKRSAIARARRKAAALYLQRKKRASSKDSFGRSSYSKMRRTASKWVVLKRLGRRKLVMAKDGLRPQNITDYLLSKGLSKKEVDAGYNWQHKRARSRKIARLIAGSGETKNKKYKKPKLKLTRAGQ